MTTTALLGLWAQTSIHAGAGSSIDGIDLPIQREGHNGWPCVFGSSMKGALRTKAEDLWGEKGKDSVRYVFGPDSDNQIDENNPKPRASEHAGALMVSDARLLLLPVRSLTGYFKWVTCPALLKRLQNDAQCFDVLIDAYDIPPVTELESGLQPQAEGHLFLEEYRITTQRGDLANIITVLSRLSGIAEADLTAQLVIVSDAMFTYLCQFATPVTAHIAIDNTTKTVKKGALWYEETLPPETVFYLALKANAVRDAQAKFDDNSIVKDSKAKAVLDSITDVLLAKPYLQIGGNETVGMGWCKVQISKGA
ncbi:MAG: type III-B CRISPR module RAMP protein Cmr4 [Methylococcales bacterium]